VSIQRPAKVKPSFGRFQGFTLKLIKATNMNGLVIFCGLLYLENQRHNRHHH